ncbi:DUF2793 domain-containing protein [Roseobacter litoralis]|uniref:DUF2793 domain-containing protein n=1 Tax=Roseobacter litoralis TaxID=42443 RepID=UPI002495440E|nr:DUF2793 domain-containing protein [Roseobacter litoralis]
MADISSSLSMPFIQPSQAQKHVTHNEALRILDVVTQLGVAADDQTTPPTSPTDGTRYIIDAGGINEWANHEGEVALFENGAWRFFVPRAGWRAYVINRDALVVYDGAEWIDLDSPELEEIETFGLGMNTLPGTPFSAKLNAALWTALYRADGGTGSLLKTLNKETSADDSGFVFQQGFQTRALFGLFGSDNLRVATTSDGTNFLDALIADNATGIVDQPRLPRFKGVTNFDNFCPAGTWTKIAINDLEYNEQAVFDAATNQFIVPVDGTYQLGALLTFKADSSSAARMGAQLLIDGVTPITGSEVENTAAHFNGRTTISIQTLASLSAGSTVELHGIMRSQPGYFMADRTDFWGFKVG